MAGRTQSPPSVLKPWDRSDLEFTTLCGMNSGDIRDFIANVAKDSANSKDEKLKGYSGDLKKASEAINEIVVQNKVKYFLKQNTTELAPKVLMFEDDIVSCFSLYDVLGWFMSVIGPAPKGTTKENYLVPMANLFCRWSTTLGGRADVPSMNSVVYVPSTNQSLISADCFLGFTLPNARKQEGEEKNLKTKSQEQRLIMLRKWFDCPSDKAPPTPGKRSPAQCFGHCAETLTFIMAKILLTKDKNSNRSIEPQKMTGVAMWTADVHASAMPDPVLESLRDPCLNCQYLVKEMLGADLKKFLVSPSGVEEYEGADEKATEERETSQKPAAPPKTSSAQLANKPPATSNTPATSKPSPAQVASKPPAPPKPSYAQAAKGTPAPPKPSPAQLANKTPATSKPSPAQVASQPPAPPSTSSAQKVDNPAVGVMGHIAAGVMNPKTEKK